MTTESALPAPIASYLSATNNHDAAAFQSAFAPDAVVHDIGREIRGHAAIMKWATEEIFAVAVTLELLASTLSKEQIILTVKVDGTFDRTGLPAPLIMEHLITVAGGKITSLSCRLKS